MLTYPKLMSLYEREGVSYDATLGRQVFSKSKEHKLIIGQYARPEFECIKHWTVDEKVDGTNIRISLTRQEINGTQVDRLNFDGRTSNSQIPSTLYHYLSQTFTLEKLNPYFASANQVILFGEGYGSKIQAVGSRYSQEVSFALFDVYIDGWWCQKDKVKIIADGLGIKTAPDVTQSVGTKIQDIVDWVASKPKSLLAESELELEGVVARSNPLMLFRDGTPVMFKLRCKDF